MSDPIASIAADEGAPVQTPEGEVVHEQPTFLTNLTSVFLPCSEDPLSYGGIVANFVNQKLGERSGVSPSEIFVGQNASHCLNHLFPGSGSLGWPPIVNLIRSYVDYREKALQQMAPDQPKR